MHVPEIFGLGEKWHPTGWKEGFLEKFWSSKRKSNIYWKQRLFYDECLLCGTLYFSENHMNRHGTKHLEEDSTTNLPKKTHQKTLNKEWRDKRRNGVMWMMKKLRHIILQKVI